jgi:hypothetical protein
MNPGWVSWALHLLDIGFLTVQLRVSKRRRSSFGFLSSGHLPCELVATRPPTEFGGPPGALVS